MTDMARLAGVSASTVSRALADNPLIAAETRARIQDLARVAGYSINPTASSLRTKQSRVMAVVIPLVHGRDQHLSDPFMMSMLAYLADALTEGGYDLLLSKVATHQDGWVEQLIRSRRVAGAILVGQSVEHPAIDRAARAGMPIVVWGARIEDQAYVTVGTDNRQGGYLAARHLIESGRRRIVFLGERKVPEISQRYDGYLRAHMEAGLALDPGLDVRSGFAAAEAYRSAQRLLAAGVAFDGIVCGSDVIAMSAIRALSEAGLRTPRDVGVVGFDDVEMAAFTAPPLTTIRQDIERGALLLVEKVVAAETDPGASIEMPATLIVRGST
jgi:DNA-binding LacI/PurR family transcriptional regulator